MDFSYTKQEELFLQMIREFAEKEVKPLAAEVDEEERFPMETVQKMAKIGLMGIPIPTQYGGAGGTNIMYGMAVEELSRVCATTGVILSAHTSLCCAPILEAGTSASPSPTPVPTPPASRPSPSRTVITGCSTAARFSSPTAPTPTCSSSSP